MPDFSVTICCFLMAMIGCLPIMLSSSPNHEALGFVMTPRGFAGWQTEAATPLTNAPVLLQSQHLVGLPPGQLRPLRSQTVKLRGALQCSAKEGEASSEKESRNMDLVLNIEEATKLTAAYGGSGLRVGAVRKTEAYTLRGLTAVGAKQEGESCAEVPLEHTLAVPFRLGDDPWYCEMALRLLGAAQVICSMSTNKIPETDTASCSARGAATPGKRPIL